MLRAMLAVVVAIVALGASVARADGEAGLVIHWGDGRVETHCIPFEGDRITGDTMLARAGHSVNQFSGLVCAIDNVGCQHSGSFSSCTCECNGGDGCTYWAFFRQEYGGSWAYSAVGLSLAEAGDGDLHAWKWGEGGPASAPAPPPTTFEAVCGHPPGGFSQATPTATSPPPTPTSPPISTEAAPTATAVPATLAPEDTATPAGPEKSPTQGASATVVDAASPAPTVTREQTTIPVETPAAPETGEDGGGSGTGGLVAFATIASALVVATGGALVWRRRHGA